MAGGLFMQAVRDSGARLLPIDSEHNAIFQCLPRQSLSEEEANLSGAQPGAQGVCKILLSASGGPFRNWSVEQMGTATPEQACAHPNWRMGRKISVDSATLMNKGLELIEACWLFGLGEDEVEVVVHPQSIVHSMVQYVDGSVLAQLGNPDMRTPIAYGLAWPERINSGVAELDIIGIGRLDFEAPDSIRFPCLRLAREAARASYERALRLELRLLADVGLVGLPNAGKSTFLRRVSAATPKVADYPFTTLYPHLGVVEGGVVKIDAEKSFVIADIPGLIAGAAEGAGLGIQFLKHLARTRLLLHLVDIAAQSDAAEIAAEVRAIERELATYDDALIAKPRWLALNKIDALDNAAAKATEAALIKALDWRAPVFRVSAVSGAGCDDLLAAAASALTEIRQLP